MYSTRFALVRAVDGGWTMDASELEDKLHQGLVKNKYVTVPTKPA
jgi:hypothetical protein